MCLSIALVDSRILRTIDLSPRDANEAASAGPTCRSFWLETLRVGSISFAFRQGSAGTRESARDSNTRDRKRSTPKNNISEELIFMKYFYSIVYYPFCWGYLPAEYCLRSQHKFIMVHHINMVLLGISIGTIYIVTIGVNTVSVTYRQCTITTSMVEYFDVAWDFR